MLRSTSQQLNISQQPLLPVLHQSEREIVDSWRITTQAISKILGTSIDEADCFLQHHLQERQGRLRQENPAEQRSPGCKGSHPEKDQDNQDIACQDMLMSLQGYLGSHEDDEFSHHEWEAVHVPASIIEQAQWRVLADKLASERNGINDVSGPSNDGKRCCRLMNGHRGQIQDCVVCFSEQVQIMDILPCGHGVCKICWTHHIKACLEEYAGEVPCPMRCGMPVPIEFLLRSTCQSGLSSLWASVVKSLCSRVTDAANVLHAKLKERTIFWCRNQFCGMPVTLTGSSMSAEKRWEALKHCAFCECGWGQCTAPGCELEAHWPASCQVAQHWQSKQVKQEANSVVCKKWILENTKPCPQCGVDIQKNLGCNHMSCSKCKFEFCWQCGQSYRQGHIPALCRSENWDNVRKKFGKKMPRDSHTRLDSLSSNNEDEGQSSMLTVSISQEHRHNSVLKRAWARIASKKRRKSNTECSQPILSPADEQRGPMLHDRPALAACIAMFDQASETKGLAMQVWQVCQRAKQQHLMQVDVSKSVHRKLENMWMESTSSSQNNFPYAEHSKQAGEVSQLSPEACRCAMLCMAAVVKAINIAAWATAEACLNACLNQDTCTILVHYKNKLVSESISLFDLIADDVVFGLSEKHDQISSLSSQQTTMSCAYNRRSNVLRLIKQFMAEY